MGDVALGADGLTAAVALEEGEAQGGAELAQLEAAQAPGEDDAGAEEERDEEVLAQMKESTALRPSEKETGAIAGATRVEVVSTGLPFRPLGWGWGWGRV